MSPAAVRGGAGGLSGRGAGAASSSVAGLVTGSAWLQAAAAAGHPLSRRAAGMKGALSLQAEGERPQPSSSLAPPSHLPVRSYSTASSSWPATCASLSSTAEGGALESSPPPNSPPAPSPRGGSLLLPASTPLPLGTPSEHPSPEMGIFSYRMALRYDGTAYSGWQLQPSTPTIQAAMEAALSTALREPRDKLKVGAAGRTDAGVHAEGQVLHFYSDQPGLAERGAEVVYRINRLLPEDIRVSALRRTAPDFNATISSCGKTYHYYIERSAEHHPMTRRYRLHHPRPLDLGRMRAAAAAVPGTHDFTRFSNLVREAERRNPVKSVRRLDLVELGDGALRLEFEGSGFLYKMVRHLTGALLAVGRGKLEPEFVEQQLRVGSSQEEAVRGTYRGYQVAPAKGLLLFQVDYPPEADDPSCLLYPHLPHDRYGRLLDVSIQSICPNED